MAPATMAVEPALVPEAPRSDCSEPDMPWLWPEVPTVTPPTTTSSCSAIHVQKLRESLRLEGKSLRQKLDQALLTQVGRQEQLFARCLENLGLSDLGAETADGLSGFGLAFPRDRSAGCSPKGAEGGQPSLRLGDLRLAEDNFEPALLLQARTAAAAFAAADVSVSPLAATSATPPRGTEAAMFRSPAVAPADCEQIGELMNPSEEYFSEEQHASAEPLSPKGRKLKLTRSSSGLLNLHSLQNNVASLQEIRNSTRSWANERSVLPRCFKLSNRFTSMLDWWEKLEEPKRTSRLATFVTGKRFESFCALIIITNAILSWVQADREIVTLETEPTYFMNMAEYFFVSFYTMELILKLCVHRLYYFCNEEMRWNIFDAILVTFSVVDQSLTLLMVSSMDGQGSDFTFMRTLRILKMARVLRGLRVLRFFYSLRLMLNSLIGSLSSLFWSMCMMSLFYFIFALVFVQGTANLLIEEHSRGLDIDRSKLIDTFGSVDRAILALYMASTGGVDWEVFAAALAPTGLLYYFLWVFFIAFSQIALLNILTAIFVQRAMQLAQPDRETQALEKRNKQISEIDELRRIIVELDTEHEGWLTMAEFSRNVTTGKLGAQLSVLGLEIEDANRFFALVATEQCGDRIRIDEFVERCMRMRGSASCIDMQFLKTHLTCLQKAQDRLQQELLCKLDRCLSDRQPHRRNSRCFTVTA